MRSLAALLQKGRGGRPRMGRAHRRPVFELRLFLWLCFALVRVTRPLSPSLIISGRGKTTHRAGLHYHELYTYLLAEFPPQPWIPSLSPAYTQGNWASGTLQTWSGSRHQRVVGPGFKIRNQGAWPWPLCSGAFHGDAHRSHQAGCAWSKTALGKLPCALFWGRFFIRPHANIFSTGFKGN